MGLSQWSSAANLFWTGGAGVPGDWFDAGNWAWRVPLSSDIAYVNGDGVIQISSGNPMVNQLHIGYFGAATLTQTGGDLNALIVSVGRRVGGVGTYQLSDGSMTLSRLIVGGQGNGLFRQTGGTVHVVNSNYLANPNALLVGLGAGGSGTYQLVNGELLADHGSIGYYGSGLFEQSGGTFTTTGYLDIGDQAGSSGQYEMSAGNLNVQGDLNIGATNLAPGTFVQTGGAVAVAGSVTLGRGNGSYLLQGGSLQVSSMQFGYSTAEVFTQSGGSNDTGVLHLGPMGRYDLEGGTLTASGGTLDGTIDFGGSAGGVFDVGGMVRMSSAANFANTDAATLHVLSSGLLYLPAGYDLSTHFSGTILNDGVIATPGSPIFIPADANIGASSFIPDHVTAAGVIHSLDYANPLTLDGGVTVLDNGNVDLINYDDYLGSYAEGSLRVADTVSGISGNGQLTAYDEFIGWGGNADFHQSGGLNSIYHNLVIAGSASTDTATYELTGGEISVFKYSELTLSQLFVGAPVASDLVQTPQSGGGKLIQSGGSVDVGTTYIGPGGQLDLSGGTFQAGLLRVGYFGGPALVNHTAGDMVLGGISVGSFRSGNATYSLSGTGTISAQSIVVTTNGCFTQSGNTNVSLNELTVDGSSSATQSPVFEMSGGQLTDGYETIGKYSQGTFIQKAGTHIVQGYLMLGHQDQGAGTFELQGGSLSAQVISVGDGGSGPSSLIQSGGSLSSDALGVGTGTSPGTYELSGGVVNLKSLGVAAQLDGEIRQTGGTITVQGDSSFPILYIGTGYRTDPGYRGLYEMINGSLTVNGDVQIGGDGGTKGIFQQSGGTVSMRDILMGQYGATGIYRLAGGTLSANRVIMGWSGGLGSITQSGATSASFQSVSLFNGSYSMNGGKLDVASTEVIGNGGTDGDSATFTQNGGMHTISTSLSVTMFPSNGPATFELNGGTLTAPEEYLGSQQGRYDFVGVFRQHGGSNTVGYLDIHPGSRYEYAGGALNVGAGLDDVGTFDFAGAAVTLNVTGGLVNFARDGAQLLNSSNASVVGSAHSLIIFSAGFDPASAFASYDQPGITHFAGSTLVVPDGKGFTGKGEIDDHVEAHDSILTTPNGFINLNGGLRVYDGKTVDLGTGKLTVDDQHSALDGTLHMKNFVLGNTGTGQFIQEDGNMTVSGAPAPNTSYPQYAGVIIGYQPGSSGTYILNHGNFTVSGTNGTGASFDVGLNGIGRVIQNDGTVTAPSLNLGSDTASSGTYELHDGTLNTTYTELIGGTGTGRFIQTGGDHIVGGLIQMGYSWEYLGVGSGRYDLSGGELTTPELALGYTGKGTFNQSGGTVTVNGTLLVGDNRKATSVYNISNGHLSAVNVQLAPYGGYGNIQQSGGSVRVKEAIQIGGTADSVTDYTISGGQLQAGSITVASRSSEGSGTLNLASRKASVTVKKLLQFDYGSQLVAVPRSSISMDGASFDNQNVDPSLMVDLSNLELDFGGSSSQPLTFEVAGRDLGPVSGGLDSNFALGTLEIGHGHDTAWLKLVDLFDNQSGGTEALYVDTLKIYHGSLLDLNGLNLYYNRLQDAGGTIDLNGGQLLPISDSLGAALAAASLPTSAVPEPAAGGLLLIGCAGLLARRSRRWRRAAST